ncbi:hypothetical protein F5Y09DRAFT_111633 [Xylaria sp. FL1042]|nr:hypothetical protein F5Y09DRAFT_111633 [Xylaria sp. FL1042]
MVRRFEDSICDLPAKVRTIQAERKGTQDSRPGWSNLSRALAQPGRVSPGSDECWRESPGHCPGGLPYWGSPTKTDWPASRRSESLAKVSPAYFPRLTHHPHVSAIRVRGAEARRGWGGKRKERGRGRRRRNSQRGHVFFLPCLEAPSVALVASNDDPTLTCSYGRELAVGLCGFEREGKRKKKSGSTAIGTALVGSVTRSLPGKPDRPDPVRALPRCFVCLLLQCCQCSMLNAMLSADVDDGRWSARDLLGKRPAYLGSLYEPNLLWRCS